MTNQVKIIVVSNQGVLLNKVEDKIIWSNSPEAIMQSFAPALSSYEASYLLSKHMSDDQLGNLSYIAVVPDLSDDKVSPQQCYEKSGFCWIPLEMQCAGNFMH